MFNLGPDAVQQPALCAGHAVPDSRHTREWVYRGVRPAIARGGGVRTVPVSSSSCGLPSTSKAYALNATLVPISGGPVSFLTLWPTGQARPFVNTVVEPRGRVVATNAIIAAGTSGSIDIYASNSTDLVLDVNGYFTQSSGLEFYPVTPCRIVETRQSEAPPDIGALFGPPGLVAGATRSFPLPQGRCNIPSTSQAYYVNFTVVPPGPLGYLTTYPSGQALPFVSTLNSIDGRVLANGAIVPAGSNGGIDVFVTNPTHLIIDIAGYFAPGNGSGQLLSTLQPCRAATLDMSTTLDRAAQVAGVCGAPTTASGFAMNVTATMNQPVGYFSAWPTGQPWPGVSLMNAGDAVTGGAVGNGALVRAGTGGQINIRSTNPSTVTLDLTGYFTSSSSGGDTTPPVITGVLHSGVTSSGATIAWSTSEGSSTQVDYGTSAAYGASTTFNGAMVTSHSAALVGLVPNTVYYYRVRSQDAAGNQALPVAAGPFTTGSSGGGPPPPTPPSVWKGITYSPRGHTYFRMLYDWYGYGLASVVDQDLTRLSQAGYNLVHLYLWDKLALNRACEEQAPAGCNPLVGEPAGFLSGPDGQPEYSDHLQWDALNDFVSVAESKNIYVAIHFFSQRFQDARDDPARATEYVQWATKFINRLTPQHRNVLLWGLAFSYAPGYSTFPAVYNGIDTAARNASPLPGSLGIIGVDLDFRFLPEPSNSEIQARLSGYSWNWAGARSQVQQAQSSLGRDADVYMLQLYNANSADLKQNVCSFLNGTGLATNGTCPNPTISPSKVFAVEYATASSVQSGAQVGGVPFSTFSWGDAQTPATTLAGQAQWITNTLCVFESLGIKKAAYWAMYDPIAMWTTVPWKKVGTDLGWNGFWGLAHESAALGDKPAWSVMANYNPFSGTGLSCQSPAVPVLSLTPSTDYYTVSQPVRVTWTAGDVTALNVNGGQGASRACTNEGGDFKLLSGTSFLGSCAFGDAPAFSNTGTYPVTLNATPSKTATVNVQVGLAPVVTGVLDQGYTTSIQPYDTVIVFGKGFSLTSTSTLRFIRSGYSDVWCYNGDGHYFWNQSHNQINASLDGRLALGTWQLEIRNGYTGTPSAAVSVVIQ